ncbi:MAG TPA: hypothetical protein VMS77_06810 [Conexivisphaerales archaeon]|nr:hypothetical protein [Conexivisphaerales archaeon]
MAKRFQLVIVVALVVIFSVAAAYDFIAAQAPPSNQEKVDTCATKMTFNGTVYCSFDVTGFTTVSNQGYANMNHPVDFMGVLFQTICPYGYDGCPNPGTVTTVTSLGVVQMNLTFADRRSEMVSVVFGDDIPPPVLSKHSNPVAGFEILGPYDSLKLVLLVQA